VKGSVTRGRPRVRRILEHLMTSDEYEAMTTKQVASEGRRRGVFLNSHTFEVDLFVEGNHEVMCDALESLTANGAARKRAQEWKADPDSLNTVQLLKDIEAIGKGRFAQRVAAIADAPAVPKYIRRGVKYVADRC
jgi:putative ATP-dependent endonuclease of the OLD family